MRDDAKTQGDDGEMEICPTCGESFGTPEELKAHQRQMHADELTPETPGQLDESG